MFALTGCATDVNSAAENTDQLAAAAAAPEKPAYKVVKYKEPVVFREIRKYHTGEIDVYKTFEYKKGTDNLISATTFDSAEEILDYLKTEYNEGSVKYSYFSKNNELIKTKNIIKDSSGNIIEITMSDSSGKQISRSEYEYNGSLKTKWSIYNSNDALLAYNTYSYDKNGNNTEIKSFSPAGALEEYFINEFDDSGNIISVKHYSSDEKLLDSSKHVFENGWIKEETFYKGEKTLQRKKMYTYNDNFSFQSCNISIAGGQTIEIIEKEFFFIEKEKTIMQ